MKIVLTILIALFVWMNAAFAQSQTPSLKFTSKFNDIDIIKSSTRSINVGDTLLFISSEYNDDYLNICFDNKCLKYSNIEMGIDNPAYLRLFDAEHVHKNDNILWILTLDGIFMFDGENITRNTKLLKIPDSPYKGYFNFGLYKHSNGDIYISGTNQHLIKYDGIK
ncbi:MAG: hypothetical protein IAE98_00940 [Candidatus Kapabacteria bacterium]|nr:hypothetical protein [Candidatus Kapabacteria bacterium]